MSGNSTKPERNYYEVLGVSSTASYEELRKAFKSLSQMYHPDKSSADENEYTLICKAWRTLKDSAKKAVYDLGVAQGFEHHEFKSTLVGTLDELTNRIVEHAGNAMLGTRKLDLKQLILGQVIDEARRQHQALAGLERAIKNIGNAIESIEEGRTTHYVLRLERRLEQMQSVRHRIKMKLAVLQLIKDEGTGISQKLEESQTPSLITWTDIA